MSNALIYLDRHSDLSFQTQTRERLVTLLLAGALPADRPIPSSRKLAEQLRVSRNTVVLACERLLAEGYLLSRQRSGLYVNPEVIEGRAGGLDAQYAAGAVGAATWVGIAAPCW